MSESSTIARTPQPITATSLTADLRRLGLASGMTVMVHSSLSAIGWVVGGAHAVVDALLQAVADDGTIMMPTHSGACSDPSSWENPPVPEAWWSTIREEMPAYDPDLTPTLGMGAIVECFRHTPGVLRSAHPTVSAAALGPDAAELVGEHTFEAGMGEGSPQSRLYDLDGQILLLGVTHSNNTSLHLSEHRAAPSHAPTSVYSSPMLVDGRRRWVTHTNLLDDETDFDEIGAAFAHTGAELTGAVGLATARLMPARALVDFGAEWMRANRSWEPA